MPVKFDIFEDRGLTCIRLVGDVDLSDILEHLIAYKADPCFRPDLDEFIDLSDWTNTDMGYKEMRQFRYAQRLQQSKSQTKTRCSIYAPSDFQYGMARIYVSLADASGEVSSQVFEKRDHALAFLDICASDMPSVSTIKKTPQNASLALRKAVL
ncbi:hypothetical protein [uncultured Pelagimonas sp.]|uniref:hypothetical protein n=1 Tax=uncultured Pelagimonas sp. TaxID=1618102 RepID=UPI00260BFD16|nr:hypothetical protein [uncultured Pelagimonas sp.]